MSARPLSSFPFNCEIAFSAPSSPIDTKPNPLDRPVSRSVMILTDSTSPHCANKSFRSLGAEFFSGECLFASTQLECRQPPARGRTLAVGRRKGSVSRVRKSVVSYFWAISPKQRANKPLPVKHSKIFPKLHEEGLIALVASKR